MEQKTQIKQTSKKPAKVFKAGALEAVIWENQTEKGVFYTVSLKRDYKDQQTWKTTTRLRLNDLPKAAVLLQKAYEFIILQENLSAQKA